MAASCAVAARVTYQRVRSPRGQRHFPCPCRPCREIAAVRRGNEFRVAHVCVSGLKRE
ncbi:hypothetical protein DA2_3167 [Desulfovibrio sp. A2]|nr:hypothetical protein DA2_3167 [Desulfovibrio sp. A2]